MKFFQLMLHPPFDLISILCFNQVGFGRTKECTWNEVVVLLSTHHDNG